MGRRHSVGKSAVVESPAAASADNSQSGKKRKQDVALTTKTVKAVAKPAKKAVSKGSAPAKKMKKKTK